MAGTTPQTMLPEQESYLVDFNSCSTTTPLTTRSITASGLFVAQASNGTSRRVGPLRLVQINGQCKDHQRQIRARQRRHPHHDRRYPVTQTAIPWIRPRDTQQRILRRPAGTGPRQRQSLELARDADSSLPSESRKPEAPSPPLAPRPGYKPARTRPDVAKRPQQGQNRHR